MNILKESFDEIKIMIKIFNSYENTNTIKNIQERCKILFSVEGVWNFYIIRLDNIEDIKFLHKDICGILIGQEDSSILFEEKGFDFADLKSIQILIEKFNLIILKVPIFSNYNVMLYSKQKEIIDRINKRILELNSNEFDIENISNINDSKNFLLV